MICLIIKVQWQLVFITNFIIVTEKTSFFSPIFSEKAFTFPLFAAGNYIIHKTGDCTVEVNANRRRLFFWGGKKAIPVES